MAYIAVVGILARRCLPCRRAATVRPPVLVQVARRGDVHQGCQRGRDAGQCPDPRLPLGPAGRRGCASTDDRCRGEPADHDPAAQFGGDVVRIVRVATTPVRGEESYRIFVDELLNPMAQQGGAAVNMVVRQSIPVFFCRRRRSAAGRPWTVTRVNGGYRLTATNTGTTRLRVANLSIADANGRVVGTQQGLAGYVLSRPRR